MLELLVLCALCAAVAWLVLQAFRPEPPHAERIANAIVVVMATFLVFGTGYTPPLPFGGVAAQFASVFILSFGGAVLRRLA